MENGLTLVELLIALALIGFVLLAILPLFISSVKSNYSANEYTSIHVLARDKLEELENLPINSPDLTEGTHAGGTHGDLPDFAVDPKTGVPFLATTPGAVPNPFTRTWQVTNMKLPDTGSVGPPAPFPTPVFIPTPVTGLTPYDFKQIDVTVVTDQGHLGIGSRRAMVTGFVRNPNPQSTPIPTPLPTPTP